MIDFKDPKVWASVCAWMVPVIIIAGIFLSRVRCWDVTETFTFVGALAGPFSALAGFLYIYATFQLQIEDQINQTFFKLLEGYILLRDRTPLYLDTNFLNRLIKDLVYSKEELRSVKGDEAFNIYKSFVFYWAESPLGWKSLQKNVFDKRGNDYEYVPYRDDFKFETASQNEMAFLLKATMNEASFGSYLRSIKYLLEFCLKNDKPEFLTIIEANQGRDERVLLFYYFGLIADKNLKIFLAKNNYLRSVGKKHLFSAKHYEYLYS